MEIDIVMEANTPLWKAHDVSQQLQDKIEVLPNVERAFVHVDYETTHAPVSFLNLRKDSHLIPCHRSTVKTYDAVAQGRMTLFNHVPFMRCNI